MSERFYFIYEKMHLWNFGLFVFENAFMNVWFFLECIYNVCVNDFILFMRKCIYEILDFLFLTMHLWMYDFFWNAYIMYVYMILFYLWENTIMKFWTFCFWKCNYEILDFLFLKMHLWMYDFFLECIYNVCLNDFILFYEKMHLWNFGFFLFENTFMNGWFFWIYFCFLFICMHAYFFFENAYINGIFGNAYTMYEILEKCIRDFVNAYVDIHKLILFLWKYKHENLFFIFFQIFHFF